MNQRLQRYTGILFIFLALLTVITGVYVTAENREVSERSREVAECQAKYNQQFIDQLRVRSEISESDREAMAKLVQEVINAKSREDSRKALTDYLETKERNDEQRKRHPLAKLPASARC